MDRVFLDEAARDGDRAHTPVTLRDVAARAGVHPSTASRALSTQRAGPSTRRPSSASAPRPPSSATARTRSRAACGRSGRYTIGMVVPDLTNPLFPPIARGIEDRLNDGGYTLILANTDDDVAREHAVIEALTARRIDGLVLATARRSSTTVEEVRRSALPVVLVNRGSDDPAVSSVTGDDHAGIGLAVRHLAELGHRRIAFVGGSTETPTGLARYQSFVSWMQSGDGLEVRPGARRAGGLVPRGDGRRGLRGAARPGRRVHGRRHRQRPDRARLLRRRPRARPARPGRLLDHRLQRHRASATSSTRR